MVTVLFKRVLELIESDFFFLSTLPQISLKSVSEIVLGDHQISGQFRMIFNLLRHLKRQEM